MKQNILKNLQKRVSAFGVYDDFFVVVDEINRVLFFSKNLIMQKGFKLKLSPNNPNEKSTKFSKYFKYLIITNKNVVNLFDLEKKKFVYKLENKYDILSVSIDRNNRYLAIGDIDGRVVLHNIAIKKEISEIIKHKDFISDLDFCDMANEIIAGSYDKAVLFINTSDFNKKERYLHIKKVKKVEEKEYVVSCDEISDTIKWDVLKFDSKDRVDFYRDFKDFFIDKEILVMLTSKKIILYDLEKEVILNENFLEINSADKIAVFNNYLLISLENGFVYYYNLLENESELLDYILKEDFKKAYELIDKNPFLKRSKGYEKLEKLVELKIKEAKKIFEIDPIKGVASLQKLLEVPFLREKIQEIINHYTNLVKFKKAILSGNYVLAYELANKYPLLKETKYYEILEKKWELSLEKALKLLKERKIIQAKEVLQPFRGVSSKLELIELVLKKYELIFLLKEKLAKRDFKGFFDLIKNHPELKKTKEYKKVIEYANRLYEKAKEYLKNEEFEKAKKIALTLSQIPPFEEKAEKILRRIEIILRFLSFISNKEYEKVFEYVRLYPFLKELKSYKEFIKEYEENVFKAEVLMGKGKKEEANKLLNSYNNRFTSKRIEKIKSLF